MLTAIIAALPLLATQGDAPVEVPFRVADDALIADANVNGHPVSCMFDTGFGGDFVLDTDTDVGKPTGKMTLRDFVGEMVVDTVKVTSLKLGSKTIDPAGKSVVKQRTKEMSDEYGQHVDGIMGLDVMSGEILEINFEHQKFIFHPKSFDITTRKPDGQKTFLAKMLPIGENSIELPVRTESGDLMTMALDTGNAFYATSHKDVLERVGIWKDGKNATFMSKSGVASGTVDSWSLFMPKVTIFGVPVEGSIWDIIDAPSGSAEGDGTVGFQFLKNFNIVIDGSRRRVWLENWTGKVTSEENASTGISALYDPRNKRMRVLWVIDGSPAEKAGIKRGDDLLSVDDKDLAQMTFGQARKMMQGRDGSKVKIAYSHEGELKREELTRIMLVNKP